VVWNGDMQVVSTPHPESGVFCGGHAREPTSHARGSHDSFVEVGEAVPALAYSADSPAVYSPAELPTGGSAFVQLVGGGEPAESGYLLCEIDHGAMVVPAGRSSTRCR
jgi:hypothetical protein